MCCINPRRRRRILLYLLKVHEFQLSHNQNTAENTKQSQAGPTSIEKVTLPILARMRPNLPRFVLGCETAR